jgi:hypothetical protein
VTTCAVRRHPPFLVAPAPASRVPGVVAARPAWLLRAVVVVAAAPVVSPVGAGRSGPVGCGLRGGLGAVPPRVPPLPGLRGHEGVFGSSGKPERPG